MAVQAATCGHSRQAVAAMLQETGVLRQAFEIFIDGGVVRTVERRHQPAVDGQADDDIGQGKPQSGDIGLGGRELMFEDAHFLVPAADADVEAMGVLELRVLAHQCHECIGPGRIEFDGLPIHPLLHPSAGGRLARQQLVVVLVFAGQIAADGIGFPQRAGFIDDHRHLSVGIEAQELGTVGGREATAPVLAFVGYAQFFAGPQDFSDVDGRGFAENLQGVFHLSYSIANGVYVIVGAVCRKGVSTGFRCLRLIASLPTTTPESADLCTWYPDSIVARRCKFSDRV
ncbi:hypothetical protein EMIT0P291_20139 [Pseudomonas sp. IT-P291]